MFEEDAVGNMRRAWILPTAGAVLVGSATGLGLILFRKNGFFELTLPELTVWSVVVGTMTVAFLGLVYAQMRAPSVERRTRLALFGLFGAVCGLIAGVVYGVLTLWNEVCVVGGIDYDYCGWSVLGSVRTSFWLSLGLLAALGVVLGTVGGVVAARIIGGRQAQTAIRTRNPILGAIVLVVAAAATTFVISRPPTIRMVATIIPPEDIPANSCSTR